MVYQFHVSETQKKNCKGHTLKTGENDVTQVVVAPFAHFSCTYYIQVMNIIWHN